jgi:S1-C subfamily serine protease
MTDPTSPDILSTLSDALADRVAAARPFIAAIEPSPGRYFSAIVWQPDVLVTSEQALPNRESYPVLLAGQGATVAQLAGRDRGTNVAVLRLSSAAAAVPGLPLAGAAPRTGTLALAIGADPEPLARLATVRVAGPAWHSMAGGRIDRLIRLDMRASHAEEGGPVLDARGGVLGMATAGPRGRALVIPHETIARVLGPLLAEGRVARGWLGVGLQPVMVPEPLRASSGQDAALMVVSLAPGGPAEGAGVLPGDILLTVDGRALDRRRAIRSALAELSPGREVELVVLRAGGRHTIKITIGARPEE